MELWRPYKSPYKLVNLGYFNPISELWALLITGVFRGAHLVPCLFSPKARCFLRVPGLVNIGLLRGRLGQRRHQTATPRGALRPRRGGGQTPRSDEKKTSFQTENNETMISSDVNNKKWKKDVARKEEMSSLAESHIFFGRSCEGWTGFGVCIRLWQSEKKLRWFCSGCSKAFPKNLRQDILDMKLPSSRNRALWYDKSILPWNLISLRNIREVMFHFRFLAWLRVAKTL